MAPVVMAETETPARGIPARGRPSARPGMIFLREWRLDVGPLEFTAPLQRHPAEERLPRGDSIAADGGVEIMGAPRNRKQPCPRNRIPQTRPACRSCQLTGQTSEQDGYHSCFRCL